MLSSRLRSKKSKEAIQVALHSQKIKISSMDEEAGGGLVWSVQPADDNSYRWLLALKVSLKDD